MLDICGFPGLECGHFCGGKNGFGRCASLGFLFGCFDLVLWYLFSFSWWFLLGVLGDLVFVICV